MIKRIMYLYYSSQRDKFFDEWLRDPNNKELFAKYDKYVQKTFNIYGHA